MRMYIDCSWCCARLAGGVCCVKEGQTNTLDALEGGKVEGVWKSVGGEGESCCTF